MNPQSAHEPHPGLAQASEEVRGFADAIRAGTVEIRPSPSSPWLNRIPELVGSMPLDSDAAARIAGLGHLSTMTLLWSIADHLYALSNCVDDRTLFPVHSLTRIVLEADARAVWLNDDGTDAETALARHIKVHQKSLRDERGRLKKAKQRLGSGERAADVGASLAKCNSDLFECATALNLLGNARNTKLPGNSAIVKEALSRANLPGLSELSYGAHSSIVHGEPFMLLQSLDTHGALHPNMLLRVSMTVGKKLTPVIEALVVTVSTIDAVSRRWDTAIDTRGLEEMVNRVWSIGKQHMDESSEELTT